MIGRGLYRKLTYALVVALALVSPYLGRYSGVPFALMAVSGFATGSRQWGRSTRVVWLAMSAAGVAVTTAVLQLPVYVTTASVIVVVATELISNSRRIENELVRWYLSMGVGASFAVVGTLAVVSYPINDLLLGVLIGVIMANTFHYLLNGKSVWLVLAVTAVTMAVVSLFSVGATVTGIGIALTITVGLGSIAYYMGTMTVSGVLGGTLLSFTTIVAGGYRWFVLLGLFVVLGAASTKYRYEEKLEMGIAEEEGGRRSFANVMANGSVALGAVLMFAISPDSVSVLAKLAFAGTIATATADTLSSELCSVHGTPRLITTFEKVPSGTDGGITLLGEIVGVVGASLIGAAGIAMGLLTPTGAVVVAVGGVVGAHIDSLLGATLEGKILNNSTVNLSACLSGAVTAAIVFALVFL
ncbi:MAG: DUF92 domain-containing protein [Halobacteria archaeon]|nr:DUF92 domain-containing protein [Halobacteria archaeon]